MLKLDYSWSNFCDLFYGSYGWTEGWDQTSLEFSEEQEEHKNQLWEVQIQMGEAVPQGWIYWAFQNNNNFASCNKCFISRQENTDD